MGGKLRGCNFVATHTRAQSRRDLSDPPSKKHLMTFQPSLISEGAPLPTNTTNFTNNMQLPIHRWFRYSAGFSAQWVESLLNGVQDARVLDPFAGSGTTLLAAQARGHTSIGVDPHPFVSRVAEGKLSWTANVSEFTRNASKVTERWSPAEMPDDLSPLLEKCFPGEIIRDLLGMRDTVWAMIESVPEDQGRLLWLAFVAIIRPVSPVGTAQWQYVLPSKSKAKSISTLEAWRHQTSLMAEDMARVQSTLASPPRADFAVADARALHEVVPTDWATHVICSPPYANNYDYADASRLEQTVLGEVSGWSDLRDVRSDLIRSCSQHMTGYDPEAALDDPILTPIEDELRTAYELLATVRLDKGGRKAYHSMVVAYFHDLAHVWHSLRKVSAPGVSVCFVVGDSAPYGVHIPVERWLGELAEDAGFRVQRFEKIRDRNTRWKNRKHRVPLHEGNLWLEG